MLLITLNYNDSLNQKTKITEDYLAHYRGMKLAKFLPEGIKHKPHHFVVRNNMLHIIHNN